MNVEFGFFDAVGNICKEVPTIKAIVILSIAASLLSVQASLGTELYYNIS
jgi:hypothetical protein